MRDVLRSIAHLERNNKKILHRQTKNVRQPTIEENERRIAVMDTIISGCILALHSK